MAYAVLTREEDATRRYAEALRGLGLEVVAMPVTRSEPTHDNLARSLDGAYDAIVCASARAAEALVATRGERTLPPVWAVGPATASTLAAAGIAARLEPGVRDAVSLANAMIATGIRGARILVPRAEDGRDELVELLRAAAATVDAVTAYRTVPTSTDDERLQRGRELLTTNAAAVCAVFAPSQVEAVDALVNVRSIDALFAAIGETTAKALRDAGARHIVVAAEPTPEGLAAAIAKGLGPRSPGR